MAAELLQGEILEAYRNVIEAAEAEKKKKKKEKKKKKLPLPPLVTEANPCSSRPFICSQGCGGNTTAEKKKKKKTAVAGWFAPPVN